MRAAVREWFDLYYGVPRAGEDTAPRVAALIVGKLCRTVFAEYETRLPPEAPDPLRRSLSALNAAAKTAMQYALVGGECLLKPVPRDGAFDFAAIRRDCYVPLARDAHGSLLAVGTMERHSVDGRQYALLERRTAGADGLTIETRLFELNGQTLGRCVPLATLPACAELVPQLVLPGVQGVGLAVLKTPLMNCVDGSTDAVSIYAPAAGLLHALARCEEQLNAEFANGASRVFASEDLLRPDAQGRRALQDDLFVGLPDDPAGASELRRVAGSARGHGAGPSAGVELHARSRAGAAVRADFAGGCGGGRGAEPPRGTRKIELGEKRHGEESDSHLRRRNDRLQMHDFFRPGRGAVLRAPGI